MAPVWIRKLNTVPQTLTPKTFFGVVQKACNPYKISSSYQTSIRRRSVKWSK